MMVYVSGSHCDTYCEHHAPDDAVPDVNNSEWDYPVHCAECHELLDATLTEYGCQYVIDGSCTLTRETLKYWQHGAKCTTTSLMMTTMTTTGIWRTNK